MSHSESTQTRRGIDAPDARGRTGLDREGYDLTGNPDVVVKSVTLLSSHWYVLRTTEFEYRHRDGRWPHAREQQPAGDIDAATRHVTMRQIGRAHV